MISLIVAPGNLCFIFCTQCSNFSNSDFLGTKSLSFLISMYSIRMDSFASIRSSNSIHDFNSETVALISNLIKLSKHRFNKKEHERGESKTSILSSFKLTHESLNNLKDVTRVLHCMSNDFRFGQNLSEHLVMYRFLHWMTSFSILGD